MCYRALFPDCEVIGFDYKAQTPWEAEREFAEYFDSLGCTICGIGAVGRNSGSSGDPSSGIGRKCASIGIIANSIGAFCAMCGCPPIDWRVPTHIIFGENNNLTSLATISEFAGGDVL